MTITITSGLLIKLAGEPVYQRGKLVYANDQIESWKLKGNTINAVVEGNHPYQVQLTLSSRMLDGACSCPASDNFDFCKHCVAVALAYSQHQEKIKNITSGSELERIEAYLKTQSSTELVGHLLALIEGDSTMINHWVIKADLSMGLVDTNTFRKKITKALPYRNIFKSRQVAAYFSNADAIFELIMEPIGELPADERIKLLQYAYDRLNKALQRIDDSGGFRYYLEDMLQQALVMSFRKSTFSNKRKVAFLARQLTHTADVYPAIPGDFIAANDTELMALFIAHCEVEWDQLLKQNKPEDPGKLAYHPLTFILLDNARQQGNTLRELKILIATANSFFEYSELSEKFIDLNQLDNAEHWLRKAEDSDQYGHRERLLPLKIRIDVARSDFEAALSKQWTLYSASPTNTNYDQLLALYLKNDLPEQSCYNKAEDLLMTMADTNTRYSSVPSSPLIEFYLHQNELDKAVNFARKVPVEAYLLHRIGLSIAKSNPQTAIDFELRSATTIANRATNQSYQDAVGLLVQLAQELEGKWKTVFQQSVAQLQKEKSLRRKPNFIKALNRQFPELRAK